MTILISDKVGCKTKSITRNKRGHFIMTKRSIHEEDKTMLNMFACNSKHMKKTIHMKN